MPLKKMKSKLGSYFNMLRFDTEARKMFAKSNKREEEEKSAPPSSLMLGNLVKFTTKMEIKEIRVVRADT